MKSSYLALLAAAVLCAFLVVGAAATEPSSELTTSQVEMLSEPVDDQTRIDMILTAYRRLPSAEIERLGIDPNVPIYAGSAEADLLFATWQQRVEEIRSVMNSVAKPVSMMEDIILTIKDKVAVFDKITTGTSSDHTTLITELMPALNELESLVSDVDNANDFHTIGGWSILSTLLSPKYPPEIRAAAAWAVGTAVKNNYDYQLWVLERFEDIQYNAMEVEVTAQEGAIPVTVYYNTSTLLNLLAAVQEDSLGPDMTLKLKLLYALSAAVRGNPDVQQAVLEADLPVPLLSTLRTQITMLLSGQDTVSDDGLKYVLKASSLLTDLVEERRYVHVELAKEAEITPELRQQMLSLQLLGNELTTPEWLEFALNNAISLSLSTSGDGMVHKSLALTAVSEFRSICTKELSSDDVENVAESEELDEESGAGEVDKTQLAAKRIVETSLAFTHSVLHQLSNAQKTELKQYFQSTETRTGRGIDYYSYYISRLAAERCVEASSGYNSALVQSVHKIVSKLSEFE